LTHNLDLMLQAMIDSAKGKPNQIVYWSRLPDWKNQTLTPNPDVIYLMPFFNTKDAGLMVLENPAGRRAVRGSSAAPQIGVFVLTTRQAGTGSSNTLACACGYPK
jgi:hypothetical protein